MFFNRKLKAGVLLLALSASLLILPACSGSSNEETTAEGESNVTLEEVKYDKLEGDIPAPKKGEVHLFNKEDSNGYTVYAYSIENFTEKEAKAYIKKLKASGVKEKHYAEVETNGYPTINFIGEAEDGTGVSFSHCKSAAAVAVSVKIK